MVSLGVKLEAKKKLVSLIALWVKILIRQSINYTQIVTIARVSWQFAEGGMWYLNVQPVVKAWEKNFNCTLSE